ncbi:AhpC/TSA antioxidant enzyme-domain-containing protein [Cadophora sp. MPI-SDFR-AT-0126]|nr:AhpC/TSA antioxidant enzyme-domain-containing protein [Leotiomycetes sp. MPI-SDFR-AT-0126]
MAISKSFLFSQNKPPPLSTNMNASTNIACPKHSSDDSFSSQDISADFSGDVNTNNNIPSQETLRRVENFPILDQDGRSIPFKNLYTGPNVTRRVLVIFIRHFYCGNCQEYIRALTASITPASLLSLPTPTFIAVVGCGSPSLISMYQSATSCPFPIYADPTKKLYNELGMIRTLNLGERPEYQRKELLSIMVAGFVQSMKMMKSGQTLKGGDMYQVGGEFMFEPVDDGSPVSTPEGELEKMLSGESISESAARNPNENLDAKGESGMLEHGPVEEKRITWCHRMRNTRDHAEIPELREVLGLDGEGVLGKNKKRWTKALLERKGTGLSGRSVDGATNAIANEGFKNKIKELDEGGRGSTSDKENRGR